MSIQGFYKEGKYNNSKSNSKLLCGTSRKRRFEGKLKTWKIISVNALAKLHTQRLLSNLESKTGNKNDM